MLKPIPAKRLRSQGDHFGIVASQYNGRFVDVMVKAAQAELERAGAEKVHVVRVPGAFEIPVVAAKLAIRTTPPLGAIICLGVILRGETAHAQLIGEAVTHMLAQVQINYEIPIIHEVLLLENEAQAKKRCLDPHHNRGIEAAQTAIAMAKIMRQFSSPREFSHSHT